MPLPLLLALSLGLAAHPLPHRPACRSSELDGRTGHATAYDARRRQVILFGGRSASPTDPYPGSTWAWNGVTWICRSDTGPGGREDAELAWDPIRERLVLYGGRRRAGATETVLTDTWEWDGARWAMRDSLGPDPRVHMVMAFDAPSGSIVLAGGGGPTTDYRDTWQWRGRGWTKLAATVPEGCIANTMVTGSRGAAWLVCAGMDSVAERIGRFGVRLLELRQGTWTAASDTGARFSPRAPTAASPEQVLLFDGWPSHEAPAATLVFQRETWSTRPGPGPDRRRSASLAYDAGRRRLVLYGGNDDTGVRGDTWEWDGDRWTRVAPHP
jgi:hypothetical protein